MKEPKEEEEIIFKEIFCKDGILLDNEGNKSLYIKRRKENEEEKKKKFQYLVEISNYHEIRIRFLLNPYKILMDLIKIYRNYDKHDQINEEILYYLTKLKKDYRELMDRIRNSTKKNCLLDLDYIIREFPPSDKMYNNEKGEFERRQNFQYREKKNRIIDFYKNKEWDKKDDKEKFEYFKIFCEIYHISYYKSK